MMQPRTSFWNKFSDEGRVKQLWAKALNETDQEKGLALLRSVLAKISQPPVFLHLWLPFLDTLLADERVQLLNANDLASIQKMGTFLQQGSDLHHAPPASSVWQRLLEAHNRRGDALLARNLALNIHEDKSTDKQMRAYCVRILARQELIDDRYLDMYMAHLRLQSTPQAETEIFHTLDLLLTIDFNAADARMRSAHRIAQFLFTLKIPLSQTLLARARKAEGIYALIYKAAPLEAREFFTQASELPGEKLLISLGLLACALRLGDESEFTRIAQSTEVLALAQLPDIVALLDLQQMLQWLAQPDNLALTPPATSKLTLPDTSLLHRLAGDEAKFALGYSYLLSGDTTLASSQFDILAKSEWRSPEWGYFAAWAFALCGEHERVASCFKQLVNWPGCWTIACLLLDLNPRLAEQAGAVAFLKNLVATAVPIAAVARTRLTLAQMAKQASSDILFEAAASLPEKLEVLRTNLARELALKKCEVAERLVHQPLFARLPLADQTFWSGLIEHGTSKSLSLLQQAADNWHYQRAALYLVVSALHEGNRQQTDHYLEQSLAKRTDLRAQLIRIYIEGYQERNDEIIQRCEQLVALGEARAGYILGNLYFYKASIQPDQAWQAHLQAALAWQRLLANTANTPEDLAALAACAAFIAYPQQRASNAQALIAHFQELDSAFHQPWLEWHVALALLWHGTPQAFSHAYPMLLRVTELASRADQLTITALVQALAGFSYRLHDGTARQHLLELLERLASISQEATSQQDISSALILAQRSLYLTADQQERAWIEMHARRYLARTPRSDLSFLWLIYLVLYNHQREEAQTLLHNAHLDNPATDHFAHSVSDLLKNTPFASTTLPGDTLLPELSRDALGVARAIVSGRIEEGYKLLLQQSNSNVLATWRIEHILPPLCRYLRQQNITPPAFLASSLYNRRLLALDSADLINLAWCAFFLGDSEQACRFWEEALARSEDDARYKGWRQDFVHFLCRLAVTDFTAHQYLAAVSQLKRAARWTLDDSDKQLSQTLLLEHALTLETRALSMLLLTYQFPDLDSSAFNPGRYHVLGLTIRQEPQLRKALISRDRERIQQEWDKTLQAQQSNMRFLHALCLIYREIALSKQRQLIDIEKDWFTSTTFWILLLSSQAFWQYFATARNGEGQDKLNAQQQEELWQDALENILIFHSAIARKSLAAGQHTQARMHARCLALGRQSKDYLLAQLQTANLSFPASIDQQRLDQIKGRTQKLLNDWGQSLVGEAEKSVNNARRIQELPEGIRKNYAGGISVLEPFIRLDVPLTHVLLVCLEWYNEWCTDMRTKGALMQHKEISAAAAQICGRLQRRCNRKNVYNAENKAIARHLIHRGLSLEESEPSQALHAFTEAQDWGSDHPDLPDLLERTRLASTEEAVRICMNDQQFEEAYRLISQAEVLVKQPESLRKLRNLRMRVSLRHGDELANQDKYTEACSRAKQALALEPGNTVLQKFMHEMEELIPEEGHAKALHLAEAALAAQDFTLALQQLARIAPDSRFFKKAQEMKNQAHLQQQAANEKEKQRAEALETSEEKEARIRAIIENSENGLSRARAREELSIILTNRAASEIDEASKLDKKSDLLRARTIYIRALLDEALELDKRNQLAEQLLIKLNKLTEQKNTEKK